MSSVIDRFMRYISIDTQSDEDSPSSPSTAKQFRLARLLAEEMTEMGVSGVRLDRCLMIRLCRIHKCSRL